MPSAIQNATSAVRRFNRFYTRQIGVLRKNYLDSPYSLGEIARTLRDPARCAHSDRGRPCA